MANTLQKVKFSTAISTPTYQQFIAQTLGDKKKVERYTAAIMSAVATNPQLQKCEASTILSGSLLAESLGLAHSPQLGQYYLVPFKVKARDDVPEHYDAVFVLGYKGYIQLAIRSGFYLHINAMEVKQGELIKYDPFDDFIDLFPIEDVEEREKAETIGYYAMFEYLNGFKKVLYWPKAQMLRHADRYSPAFSAATYARIQRGEIPEKDMWKYSSFWYKDFDGMARKTMLRQLISKWGVMSPDMQAAYEHDNKVLQRAENGGYEVIEVEDTSDIPEEPKKSEKAAEKATETAEQINIDEL